MWNKDGIEIKKKDNLYGQIKIFKVKSLGMIHLLKNTKAAYGNVND